MMAMYGKLRKIVPLIGIVVFAYILYDIGLDKIVASLLSTDPFYFSLSLSLVVPHIILQVSKWKYILSSQDIHVGFLSLTKMYLIGIFYSTITPGKVGSLIRIAYLKEKTGKDLGECGSSVIVDRVLDLLSMFILAMLGVVMFVGYLSDLLMFSIALFFLLFVGAIALFMKERFSKRILRIVYNIAVPQRFKQGAKKASSSFYGNIPGVKSLVIPFILIWSK